jgi:hypothetical protein
MGLVQLPVPRVQFHLDDLLLLGGKVRGYLFLGATLDQWFYSSSQPCEQPGVAHLLDRAVAHDKELPSVQHSPHIVGMSKDWHVDPVPLSDHARDYAIPLSCARRSRP